MLLLLNLSRRDARQIRLTGQLLAALLVGLVGLALLQVVLAGYWLRAGADGTSQVQLEELKREVDRLEAGLSAARERLTPEERRSLAARILVFNRLLEASLFSGTALLYELESALPAGVYLAEIQPEPATGKVRLLGVAATQQELAAFIRRLQERAAFREVLLLQQAEKLEVVPSGPAGVAFQAALVYRSTR